MHGNLHVDLITNNEIKLELSTKYVLQDNSTKCLEQLIVEKITQHFTLS